MNRMLIEGPEQTDSSPQDQEPQASSDKRDESVTSKSTSGVLLLGMTRLDIVLYMMSL